MSSIRVTQGDMFQSEAQTLVNTVNTVGVMGKGIALQFKQRFPRMYADYRARCDRHAVKLGRPYIYKPEVPPWIINFPTKAHWRSPSKLADIERGLDYLAEHVRGWGVESLAVPPLGCGNGELDWRVVGPVIFERMAHLDIPVLMYAPFETPMVQLEATFLAQQLELMDTGGPPPEFRVSPAVAALVEVLERLQANALGPTIGRTSFQKLAYFATEAGIPTGLRFEKSAYGPFSADLKPAITRLMNNSLIEEQAQGKLLRVRVGPAFARARGNFEDDFAQWREAIDRLVDLFSRVDGRDAEIAATVHFAAKQLHADHDSVSELEVFEYVDRWKPAKFVRSDVATAVRNLALLGWLKVRASPALPLPAAATSSAA